MKIKFIQQPLLMTVPKLVRAHLYGNNVCGDAIIGSGVSLGQNVFVGNNVKIGDKLSSEQCFSI